VKRGRQKLVKDTFHEIGALAGIEGEVYFRIRWQNGLSGALHEKERGRQGGRISRAFSALLQLTRKNVWRTTAEARSGGPGLLGSW